MPLVREVYFEWLFVKIDQDNRSYRLLADHLNRIPFRWSVPNDENREGDAIRQREIFLDEVDHPIFNKLSVMSFMDDPVSLFEVMVAISLSMDFQLDDLIHPPRVWKWFDELLLNLGLRWAVDEEFEYRLGAKLEVNEATDILLSRTYDFNGNGSFFPLRKRPKRDMATVEIWYQMMLYLEENYP